MAKTTPVPEIDFIELLIGAWSLRRRHGLRRTVLTYALRHMAGEALTHRSVADEIGISKEQVASNVRELRKLGFMVACNNDECSVGRQHDMVVIPALDARRAFEAGYAMPKDGVR